MKTTRLLVSDGSGRGQSGHARGCAAQAGAARKVWSTGWRCTGSRYELETVNK